MTAISRFHVRLYDFRASSLAAVKRGGYSDPYLNVSFDHFKEFNTVVVKRTLNPEWDEDVSFLYETKLAHKLHLKRLKIKCFNRSFLSDKLIGRCYIDLYTVFTGPSEFRLPLRDGRKIRGEVTFKCEIQEFATVEINMRDLKLELPQDVNDVYGEHASDFYLEYAYSGDEDATHSRKSPPGRTEFKYVDALYVRATFDELIEESIRFWLKKRKHLGDDAIIGTADMSLQEHYSFEEGCPVEFRLPLRLTHEFCIENRISLPDIGRISGNVFYQGFPTYLQMESGYLTDNGIYYAHFRDPNVPNKPKVYIHGMQRQDQDSDVQRRTTHSDDGVHHPPSSRRRGDIPIKHPPPRQISTNSPPVKHPPQSTQRKDEQGPNSDNKTSSGSDSKYPFAHLTAQAESGSESVQSSYPFAHLTSGNKNSPEDEVKPSFSHIISGSGSAAEKNQEDETSESGNVNSAVDAENHPLSFIISGYGAMASENKGGESDKSEEEEKSSLADEDQEDESDELKENEKGSESSSTREYDEESEDSIAALEEHKHRNELVNAVAEEKKETAEEMVEESRMLKNEQGLPWFWERCFTLDNKVFFKNHVYKGTEWELPTEPTYSALIMYAGPIGLELEPNYSGEEKFGPGKKSGRRFSKHDLGAVVSGYVEEGQASQATSGRIRKGHQIIGLNQVSLLQYDFNTCLRMIAWSKRPVRLVFLNPYAVSEEIARKASDPTMSLSRGLTVKYPSGCVSHPRPENQDPAQAIEQQDQWIPYTDSSGRRRFRMGSTPKTSIHGFVETSTSSPSTADAAFGREDPGANYKYAPPWIR